MVSMFHFSVIFLEIYEFLTESIRVYGNSIVLERNLRWITSPEELILNFSLSRYLLTLTLPPQCKPLLWFSSHLSYAE